MANHKVEKKQKTHTEAKGLLFLTLSLFFFLSLISYDATKSSANWLGIVGNTVSWTLYYLSGLGSFLIAAFIGWKGWRFLCNKGDDGRAKTFFFTLFLFSICMLLTIITEAKIPLPNFLTHNIYKEKILIDFPYNLTITRNNLGGAPAYFLYRDLPLLNLQTLLSASGCAITFSLTSLLSFFFLTAMDLRPILEKMGSALKSSLLKSYSTIKESLKEKEKPLYKEPIKETPYRQLIKEPMKKLEESVVRTFQKEKKVEEPKPTTPFEYPEPLPASGDFTNYKLPPLSLLKEMKKTDAPSLEKEIRRRAEILEETLLSFGIEAKVGDIHSGPTITSFEVHPSIGVKVQKIKALENDIALNLQAKSIRIIAPIPGKAAVGVEVPSLSPQPVGFKEMLANYQSSNKQLSIPVILGKTVSGEDVFSDLAKMPHCLIAGATGSGKSVCINTIILSILMNAKPDEVKLLMVDPKKVELSMYTRLPHMLAPVITEPSGAHAALNWLVGEMQRRYELLKQLGLRNIGSFNSRKPDKLLEESLDKPVPLKLPFIVAIIDEFADLMMVSGSDLETPIARIAQMARAVGIHLILATQRPSREVITGLIKANFPTRITFKVSSRINSQIIVDETGAESLLGNGDLLFLPPGSSSLIRAQGAYVSDDEIASIMDYILRQAGPNYEIKSFDRMTEMDLFLHEKEKSDEGKDSLFSQAMQIVIDTNSASTTYLQRKLKIGYARAASLMDELEERGVIGPAEGARPRKVLVSNGMKREEEISTFDEQL